MLRGRYPYGGDHIILRHRYPIWPLVHLISTALWIAVFILLVCALISWLYRKKMRMFHGHGYGCCHGHGRRHGRSHGHDCGHGYGRCHGHHCGHSCRHGHDCGHGHNRCHCHGHDDFTSPPSHLDALEILRQRYARGEIDDVTFQHMRERLGISAEPEQPPND